MKKQIIRLTESDLHKIITESVKNILMEDETFIDKLEAMLKLPYEARTIKMTDEDIIDLINSVKKNHLVHDFEKEEMERTQEDIARRKQAEGDAQRAKITPYMK